MTANGLVIPYMGYIELDVHYNGNTIPQHEFLIQFISVFENIYLVWLSTFIRWNYLIDNSLPMT